MIGGKSYYVYILASRRNGTLYTGVTGNLLNRIEEHKTEKYSGFTAQYNVKILVHLEIFNDPKTAIAREKNIKAWKRRWKIRLIEKTNPEWRDLYEDILKQY